MISKENARVVRGFGVIVMIVAIFIQITDISFWIGIPILLIGAAITAVGTRGLRK